MGDHADGAAVVGELADLGDHPVQGLGVEASEALVDEQCLHLHSPGLTGDDVGQAEREGEGDDEGLAPGEGLGKAGLVGAVVDDLQRSEERRVGKEWGTERRVGDYEKKVKTRPYVARD